MGIAMEMRLNNLNFILLGFLTGLILLSIGCVTNFGTTIDNIPMNSQPDIQPISLSSNSNFFDGIEEIKVEFICRQEVNEELSLDRTAITSYIEKALIQSRINIYTDKSNYSKFSKSGRPILSFYLKKVFTDGSPTIPIFVIKGELDLTVHPFNYKNEKAIDRAALFHYEEYQINKFDEKTFYSQLDNILFKFTRDICKHMDCDGYYSPGKKIIPVNQKKN